MNKQIQCGEYKHYKGGLYNVYGIATDENENIYVLYQQNYGTKSFWIRPYDMFIDQVRSEDQALVNRFTKTKARSYSLQKSLKKLSDKCNEGLIFVTHTESKNNYHIIAINLNESPNIKVHLAASSPHSAYLTDFQLAYRMGWYFYIENGKKTFHKLSAADTVASGKQFDITMPDDNGYDEDSNKKLILNNQLNPCSIDLHIASNFFFKTKRRRIDVTSVKYAKKAFPIMEGYQSKKILWCRRIFIKTSSISNYTYF